MKNTLFITSFLVFLLLGTTFQTQAQSNVIKINPLSIAVLTPNIKYERALNESMSVQLGLFYSAFGFNLSTDVSNDGRFSYNGFGITPEFRYYFTHSRNAAPKGFFAAPYFRYSSFDVGVTYTDGTPDDIIKFNNIGGGAIAGYQFIFGDVFALELFGGPGYIRRNVTDISQDFNEEDLRGIANGFTFRFGLSLGAAF